jgi:hypothetical protein
MMFRIYEKAGWPNMEERNTEGRKDDDRKGTATKNRHLRKAKSVFNFIKKIHCIICIITNKSTINITCLYVINTVTCFGIFMSSSGSSTPELC